MQNELKPVYFRSEIEECHLMSIDMHQMVDLANEVQKERWDQMKGKYGF
jgi:hypothetical protein